MRLPRLAATAVLALLTLAACAPVAVVRPAPPLPVQRPVPVIAPAAPDIPLSARAAAANFIAVTQAMGPAIERQCLMRRTAPINCAFQFVVDDRPGLEPNAFQTVGRDGRPVIGFTLSLIAATRNADELAFVIGHEASHHILSHLTQKVRSAEAGAVILGGLASAYGRDPAAVRAASSLGAQLGARQYSKQYELEADYLGAVITIAAGYNPERGAQFFLRLPDPGDHVLGSHPSRVQRLGQVARAIADYRSGRTM